MKPGAPRRGREIRQAHARRQIRRVEEPRRPDRQTVIIWRFEYRVLLRNGTGVIVGRHQRA